MWWLLPWIVFGAAVSAVFGRYAVGNRRQGSEPIRHRPTTNDQAAR